MLLVMILLPMISGIISYYPFIKKKRPVYVLIMLLSWIIAIPVFAGKTTMIHMTLVEKAGFDIGVDGFSKFVLFIVLFLYTAVLFYSFVYMEKEHCKERFYVFYFISLGAMIAVCLSQSLVTLYCFFELATLSSVPMVLHEMDKESVAAGVKYLFYSIGGALMGLCAVLCIYHFSGDDVLFRYGGFIDEGMIEGSQGLFFIMMLIGIIGFGTKAGIYPMHGWLPTAHPIAPAPASALLSGIIAKAGIIALVRLIFYSTGTQVLQGSLVQKIWLVLCMITVLLGSTMAFFEKNLKKRLAYSTVSQLSYIMIGLSCMSDSGLNGALLQVMAHAAAKCALFLAAGAFICLAGLRTVDQLKGIGKKMPLTMLCFTAASLSLIGIPPMGGFIAKWNISLAALKGSQGFFAVAPPVVLIISALLTAGYLMPVVISAFFPGEDEDGSPPEQEPLLMVLPMLILCFASLITGLYGQQILKAVMEIL